MKYIILFIMASLTGLANDGYLGTWSGNPVPGKSTDIEMSRELIYIKVHREYSQVFCKFWFYNHGKTEKVKVGFPDASSSGDEDPTTPLEKFTSIVNGKPIDLKHELQVISLDTFDFDNDGNKKDTYAFRTWYTKDIEFSGHDTTVIEDYYQARNSGFIDLMFMGQVFYFIGTGSTWKGAIGRGDIIFDHSEVFSNLFINENFVNDNPKLGYVWLNNFTQVVYKDLVPLSGESVSICFLNYFDGWGDDGSKDGPFAQYIDFRKLTQQDLYGMKEEIKARAGIKGIDFYKDCGWYEKAQSEGSGKLNDNEKLAVKNIEKHLKKSDYSPDSPAQPCKTEKAELRKLEKWKSEFEITKFIAK